MAQYDEIMARGDDPALGSAHRDRFSGPRQLPHVGPAIAVVGAADGELFACYEGCGRGGVGNEGGIGGEDSIEGQGGIGETAVITGVGSPAFGITMHHGIQPLHQSVDVLPAAGEDPDLAGEAVHAGRISIAEPGDSGGIGVALLDARLHEGFEHRCRGLHFEARRHLPAPIAVLVADEPRKAIGAGSIDLLLGGGRGLGAEGGAQHHGYQYISRHFHGTSLVRLYKVKWLKHQRKI